MRRMNWASTACTMALVFGAGGLAIQSFVVGQEAHGPRDNQVETTAETVSGRVKAFVKNDRGDTDGLTMENGTNIHFPPHLSDAVAKIVALGDQIEVRGHQRTMPRGEVVFAAERIANGDKSVDIDGPPRPPRGPRPPHGPRGRDEAPMNAKGTIREFHSNRHGDVDGLFLSDGTEVKVPPHQGAELQELAKVGAEIRVQGRRHETPHGDVHLHADRITATESGRTFERDEPHHGPHAPPHHAEIMKELREIRHLIESMQKK